MFQISSVTLAYGIDSNLKKTSQFSAFFLWVSIPLTIEATMLVPVDFDIDDLQIHDVGCDVWNSDVDDFNVQSWDVGDIEEM